MKTPDEIADLKRQWEADPCWDIEDTEGFEKHYDELLEFRLRTEAFWDKQEMDTVRQIAQCFGIDNLDLAWYLKQLEKRIEALENKNTD